MALKVEPSSYEQAKLRKLVKEITTQFNKHNKNKNILLEVGGSVAKNTWLPGIKDIDMFLKFDYNRYSKKTSKLSDLAEPILKKAFKKVDRLHGSRDYFNFTFKKTPIEVLPVLDISGSKPALNLTDYSPLHVLWLKNKLGQRNKVYTEIRKAKQFTRANKLYGAESYIQGFSGHVLEILIINYGSFDNFVNSAAKWTIPEHVDVENYYLGDTKKMRKALSASKLGPLVLIDPVDPKRNAAAALSQENFYKFIELCKKYRKAKQKKKFFIPKETKIKDLIKNKPPRSKLIVLSASPGRGKKDIAGAKILKSFKEINRKLNSYGFSIRESDWEWSGKGNALLWIYLVPKLPKEYIHWGPKKTDRAEHIKAFKKKWKPQIKNKRYYVKRTRKHTLPENYLKTILSKNFTIKKVT